MRVDAYGRDRSIVWSTDPALTGRRFPDNPELEEAFGGRHVIASGTVRAQAEKSEHGELGRPGERYVENYLPIRRGAGSEAEVVGVIEIYRTPAELFGAIEAAAARMALGAGAVALLLYLGLFALVWRAAAVIREQQAALLEAERLAVAGEMASAVAHGLGNPLASIRSCAELAPLPDRHASPVERAIAADLPPVPALQAHDAAARGRTGGRRRRTAGPDRGRDRDRQGAGDARPARGGSAGDRPLRRARLYGAARHPRRERVFGHERGAFTDARESRAGLVEAAHRGTLEAVERAVLARALAEAGGNVSAAARRLGISRDTLRDRMAEFGLEHQR